MLSIWLLLIINKLNYTCWTKTTTRQGNEEKYPVHYKYNPVVNSQIRLNKPCVNPM